MEMLSPRESEASPAARPPLPLHSLQYPQHGPMGRFITGMLALPAVFPLHLAAEAIPDSGGVAEGIIILGLGVAAALIFVWIAYAFHRFECWAWWFVFIWLAPIFAVFPLQLGAEFVEILLYLCLAIPVAGPVHYLWKRRYDFWFGSDAVRRQLDFERNGHRWARRSWKDDARVLKLRMAEKEISGRSSSATHSRSGQTPAVHRHRMSVDEPLRGAGRAG